MPSSENAPGTQDSQMVLIFRASKTDPKTGETIYAKDYGIKAFPMLVPKKTA